MHIVDHANPATGSRIPNTGSAHRATEPRGASRNVSSGNHDTSNPLADRRFDHEAIPKP